MRDIGDDGVGAIDSLRYSMHVIIIDTLQLFCQHRCSAKTVAEHSMLCEVTFVDDRGENGP
jgi:hypothetical protein